LGSAGFPGGMDTSRKRWYSAEILKQAGYTTFAVGKYGVTPDAEATDAGPFDHWPLGKGFDHFFGFLVQKQTSIILHWFRIMLLLNLMAGISANRSQIKPLAILIRQREQIRINLFLYTMHPAQHMHRTRCLMNGVIFIKAGLMMDGMPFRQKVFDNQKKLGIIPSYAQLPERNALIKAWKDLPADEQKLYARFMEVYAAYLTYTDYQVGRVINELKAINQLDNTLIFVMIGDNGASKEGTENGVVEKRWGPRYDKTVTQATYIQKNESAIDRIGTPETEPNYPLGWAQACNTPFKYWKQDAFAEGGSHNPLIIFYPKKITDKGTTRTQFSHVMIYYQLL
jgi:arylsulfatase